MKVKLTKTYEHSIDFDEEIKRINKNFKGKMRRQLLLMIDYFLLKEFDRMDEIYYNLPYDNKECHCPGQEFVGLWYRDIYNPKVVPKCVIDFF